jgi:putative Ca2+/H+ antiporter (TMEM165/GDT1 family)
MFFGEWGDRSQFTIIALCSGADYIIVFLGSTVGVMISNCIAIGGGHYLSKKISKLTLNLVSGTTFVIFSFKAFYKVYNM